MRTTTRNREAGFSLLVVLTLVLVLGTLATSATMRVRDLARDGTRDAAMLAAVHAAGGGVEAARAALARDPHWTGGDVTVGHLTASVAVVGSEGDLRPVSVLVTGRGVSKRVRAVLRLRDGRLPIIATWDE